MIQRTLLIAVVLLFPSILGAQVDSRAAAPSSSPAHSARWAFQTNFSGGIAGWMSYPLPQDVGYDPTLYTSRAGGSPVLVRDVVAHGERFLKIGMIRQLGFRVIPSSSILINYDLEVCGRIKRAEFSLGAANGKLYTHPLPVEAGKHTVKLGGAELGIPAGGDEIQVMVIEAEIASPSYESRNRLTLSALHIEAESQETLTLEAPALNRSDADDIAVSQEIVTPGTPLILRLAPGPEAQVALFDGLAAPMGTKIIPSEPLGKGRQRQITVLTPGPDTAAGLWTAKISSVAGQSSFRFLVLGEVPAHPRTLLSAERVRQLLSEPGAKDLLEVVHRKAEESRAKIQYNPAVGSNIASLSKLSVFPGLPDYFNVMESYSQEIALSALEYSLSGSPQALEAARRALLVVSAWSTWTPPWFAAHGLHTYYEVGVFTQRVAFGYDLIADHLTSAEKAQVADAFWRNAISPALQEYFYLDRMPIAASNHMAQSVGGAIAACVALYGDVPDWKSRFGPALAEMITAQERLMNGLFPGDGSEAEPAGYEDFAMEGMSWGQAALGALGIRPQGSEGMMQAFWWLRYAEFQPLMFLDTGDFETSLSALSGFAWTAENSHDPALQAFYETATNHSLAGLLHLQHTGRALEQAPGLLDLVCCTQPSANQIEPPLSRIFASRGSVALRSGWQPEDTVVSIRVGPWFNHEHHDQGSFRVAAHGEELIGEAGYADYYKDPHYADYFTQAPAHNTVVIDGDAFSQGYYDGRYWAALHQFPSITRHLFSSDFDYMSANLAPAYSGRLNTYDREYVFIKPDILIVHDQVSASSAHRFSWFLHAPIGTNAQVGNGQAIIRGKNALASLVAASGANQWKLEEGPVSQNAMGDLDRGKIEIPEVFRLDSPQEKNVGFLVGMHFQEAAEKPEALRVLRGTSSAGFELPHGAILFRTGAGFLTIGGMSGGELSAAADELAAREVGGKVEIFLSRAHSLRQGNHSWLSSSAPVDAILHATSAGQELKINCSVVTDLQVSIRKQPAAVTLNQAPISLPKAGGVIVLSRLSPGEHIVRIVD